MSVFVHAQGLKTVHAGGCKFFFKNFQKPFLEIRAKEKNFLRLSPC